MTSPRVSTRRALPAAFLLFAAVLLVVGPAEASRTTTDPQTIVAPPPHELAPLEPSWLELSSTAALAPIDPVESSPRFGFSEDLGLLDPEAGPGGFVLFARETSRCELTYARNNPLKYVDPDGKAFWSVLGKGAIHVLGYAGRASERLVARIVPKSKHEGMEAVKQAVREAKEGGARNVAVVTPTEKRAEAVARELSADGKVRGPERSGNWPQHYNPASGEFSDVHVQTEASTKKVGLGSSLLSIVAGTTLAATSNADATPSEIVSAGLWDAAKAIDPFFITDAIEYATGLNEYIERRAETDTGSQK